MTGGLGNQMFEYALYLKFKELGVEVKMEDFTEYEGRSNSRPVQLNVFGIEYDKVSLDEYYSMTDSNPALINKVLRKVRGRRSKEYEELKFAFDSNVLALRDNYITGYFQSDKYFSDIKSKILTAFTFKEEVVSEARNLLGMNGLNALDENSVSIHIRRGDYLNVSDVYGNICTEDYYDRAIEYIANKVENPSFYIFTNDNDWSSSFMEKYLAAGFNMKLITGSYESNGYLDMYLMSSCSHNIVANSSFSWWGAYLNRNENKIVIAPKRWINNHEYEDIYTDYMIRL